MTKRWRWKVQDEYKWIWTNIDNYVKINRWEWTDKDERYDEKIIRIHIYEDKWIIIKKKTLAIVQGFTN